MKLHTSFKMACGYILLTALLIGSIYYVYHQTASLTRMTGNEEVLAARRKATHRLVGQLLEAENIGQNIHFGHWSAYRQYVDCLAEVKQTIAALDSSFTDSLQKARLDTLSALLEEKRGNMGKLVAIVHFDRDALERKYHAMRGELEHKMDGIKQDLMKYVNSKVSKFSRISVVEERSEDFEKTPTHKIKRFLYTKKNHSSLG